MDKKIAVVICNFNKKDYVMQCIASVFAQDLHGISVYVVDNASTDGSSEEISRKFKDKVNLIRNFENLGGSGGFNTGIREALKWDYPYIYLLDNDVILDSKALSELVDYLESHPQTAIAGSAIYSMDCPDELQELGAVIDWENYYIQPQGKGLLGNTFSTEALECDYVPACSMLVRTEAIRKVGVMDESNFIYWDDIEWGHRMKQAGYRVAVVPSSKVWHKMGVAQRSNTFGTYYFWRNRLNFFLRNIADADVSRFTEKMFSELFQALYSCNFNQKYRSARTIMFAVEDALNNVRGKAPEERVVEADLVVPKLEEMLRDKAEILIVDFESIKTVRDVVNRIRTLRPDLAVTLAARYHDLRMLEGQFPETKIIPWNQAVFKEYPVVVQICRHVMELGNEVEPGIYIDQFLNVAGSPRDFEYIQNYQHVFKTFQMIYYPVFADKVSAFRRKYL
ncbi:MAG TPA: glycosyltransferase family 2 protein [Bacillota bacterium]|nr:glycosyltransferase family 2 protein [Bacillota bacterium]